MNDNVKNGMADESGHKATLLLAISGTALFLGGAATGLLPMGIPGQWVYPHVAPSMESFPFLQIAGSFMVGAGLAGIALAARAKSAGSPRLTLAGIILLASASIFFDWKVLECGRIGVSENIMALYDRPTTGYLEAAKDISSFRGYMSDFASGQKNLGFISHCAANPPGRTSLCHAVYGLLDRFPPLQGFILGTMPRDAADAFAAFKANDLFPFFRMDGRDQAAGMLLIYLFLVLLAAGKIFIGCSIWSLYGADTAVSSACFYLFAPAPILFLGHYDCFFGAMSAFLMLLAIMAAKRNSISISAIAGVSACISTLFSVAFGVSCLWTMAYWLWASPSENRIRHFAMKHVIPFAASYLAVIFLLQALYGFGYVEVLLGCLGNNAQFYRDQAVRTWEWKIVNYIEFICGAGIPLSLLIPGFLARRRNEMADFLRKTMSLSSDPAATASLACLLFLAFTPTRGEVGRLWIPAIPMLHLLLPRVFASFGGEKNRMLFTCGILLVAQIIVMRHFVKIVIIESP